MTSGRKRRAFRAAYSHAFFGGLGLGLFSAHLLRYLVRDLCGETGAVFVAAAFAWIVAAPRGAGVFRLLAPMLIDRVGHRKRFCMACFTLAPLLIAVMTILLPRWVGLRPDEDRIASALAALIVFWALYHLSGYFGTIALMSWYGDLVPTRIRGRFFGRREAWGTAGMALGALFLGLYSYFVIDPLPVESEKWQGYLVSIRLGIFFLLLSVMALGGIPEIPWQRRSRPFGAGFAGLLAPLIDRRFAAFVFFGCWVQMSQALTQGVQYGYSVRVLGITLLASLALSTETRIGQWLLGSPLGRWSDRIGSLPVMSLCLLLAASGSLFYYFAEKESWWLLVGASTVWIFWVGVNIGVLKTILELAPPGNNSSYFSVYFTLTALIFALFAILGGHLIPPGYEKASFLGSFVLRLLAVPLLWLVFRFIRKQDRS